MQRVRQSGAVVRSSASLSGAKVAELAGGTLVKFEERVVLDNGLARLHLVVPIRGWISEKCLSRRVIEEKNESYASLCDRCDQLLASGDAEAALRMARDAIGLLASDGRAHSCAAEALRASSRFEDAYWYRAKAASLDASLQKNVMRALEDLVLSQRPDPERFRRDAHVASTRVFAVSDIHLDHPGAMECIEAMFRDRDYSDDVLVLAGDLGDTLKAIEVCLKLLRPKFRRLFYCPGNHCLWIRDLEEDIFPDSIAKWNAIRTLCRDLDCDTAPAQVSVGVYVVPLLSWYDPHFCSSRIDRERRAFDTFCKWPVKDCDLKHVFLKWNQVVLSRCPPFDPDATVVTFSHFLPRRELPFSKHVPDLDEAMGCALIDAQLRSIVPTPAVHVFGHSHSNCSKIIEGVRYVQNAFGYSYERHLDPRQPNLACVHPPSKNAPSRRATRTTLPC